VIPARSTRGAWITLGLLGAGVAYLGFRMIQPFAAPLLTGLVMAVIFHPVHQRLAGRIRRRGLAATVSTVLMLLIFLGPLALLVVTVSREVRDLYQTHGASGINERAQRVWEAVRPPLEAIGSRLGIDAGELRDAIGSRLAQAGGALLRQSVAVVGAATGGVVFLVMSTVAFFFAIRDGPRMYQGVLEWSPLGERDTRALLEAVEQTIAASFYGVISVALAQGLLCGLGMWIAGLPSPLLWGVVASIASVIPFVGSALVWAPAAVVLFTQGSIGRGIFLLAWGAGIVGTIDNLVRPLVVTARMPLNAFLVLIAMLGGVQAFGVAGILTGPVTLMVALTLVRIIGEKLRGDGQG
jgi:predicted PurR-regulated permease PerM